MGLFLILLYAILFGLLRSIKGENLHIKWLMSRIFDGIHDEDAAYAKLGHARLPLVYIGMTALVVAGTWHCLPSDWLGWLEIPVIALGLIALFQPDMGHGLTPSKDVPTIWKSTSYFAPRYLIAGMPLFGWMLHTCGIQYGYLWALLALVWPIYALSFIVMDKLGKPDRTLTAEIVSGAFIYLLIYAGAV